MRWTFGVLRVALFARVISSWVRRQPLLQLVALVVRAYRLVHGMIDITVIVAYFGLGILESVITGALIR